MAWSGAGNLAYPYMKGFTMIYTARTIHEALHSEIQDIIREVMAYVPKTVGFEDDVTYTILDMMPDPEAFVGTNDEEHEDARDYLEALNDDLDLSGYVTREAVEGVRRDLIYTVDIHRFYEDYTDVCEEGMDDIYGNLAEAAQGCDTISDLISRAADAGSYRMWSEMVGDLICNLENMIDRFEEDIDD